jgi:hypothetical protein
MNDKQIEITRQLMYRLERLSVDSHWARRASGLRGSLLKCLEQAEMGESFDPEEEQAWLKRLDELTRQAFRIVENAAREIKARET